MKFRTFGRATAIGMSLLLVALSAGVAFADNLQDDVVAGTNDTFAAGGSTTVSFHIVGNGSDGCNVDADNAATILMNAPAGVTATPSSLTFTLCKDGSDENSQSVVFSSSLAGDYTVNPSASGGLDGNNGWNVNPAQFTLHVTGTADGLAPTGSIVINDAAAWTNNASVTVDLAGTDAVGVTRYRLATSQAGLAAASDVTVSPAETNFARSDVAFTLSSGDGSAKEAWLRLCDAANNCADFSDTIGLDTVDPVITFVSPSTSIWYNADVTANWSCSDALSGEVSATDTDTTSGEGIALSATGTCVDNAGNDASDTQYFKVDKTNPTLNPSVTPNPVVLNGSATASAGASDTLSGVASESCDPVDTSVIGSHTVACTATDNAGNTANGNASYSVEYSSGTCADGTPSLQILQPINFTGNQSGFKKGSTIPAKFKACDANGAPIGTAGLVTEFKRISYKIGSDGDITPESLAVDSTVKGSTDFRYDATSGQWIFNIDTKPDTFKANYSYYFRITLDSGQTILFDFYLKAK